MHSRVYGLGATWHMSHVPTEFPFKEATFFSQRVSKDLTEGQVYSLRGSLGDALLLDFGLKETCPQSF